MRDAWRDSNEHMKVHPDLLAFVTPFYESGNPVTGCDLRNVRSKRLQHQVAAIAKSLQQHLAKQIKLAKKL